uniref:Uncharacterized protein n=1 Tax=Candidatus Kentrum sp. LPFa TaxID=2126335 RepID=A0A450WPK8_9GAMM|nr:MAG: hypothetical protein BECKLPF1236B_GA0070989_11581 [Candidatus Kentron sp. LPFa]
MNRRQALFQYHFTLESRAPYSIIWYWKRLDRVSLAVKPVSLEVVWMNFLLNTVIQDRISGVLSYICGEVP